MFPILRFMRCSSAYMIGALVQGVPQRPCHGRRGSEELEFQKVTCKRRDALAGESTASLTERM